MNRTDAPVKQSKPFGINGQREPILPTTPAGDNTASYEQGFPPITMILKSAGGLPPKGQDMNQILFELSALARWSSAGAINSYDSAFSAAIGGYPKSALVTSVDGEILFRSTVDSNTTTPGEPGASWENITALLNLAGGSLQIVKDGSDIRDPAAFRQSLNLGSSATLNTGSGSGDVVIGSRLTAVINSLALGTASKANVGTAGTELPTNNTVSSSIGSALTAFLPKRAFASKDYIRIPDVPGGLIIQWGNFTTQLAAGTSGSITLPVSFPNSPLFALAFYSSNSANQTSFNAFPGYGSVLVLNTHPTNAATPFVLALGY